MVMDRNFMAEMDLTDQYISPSITLMGRFRSHLPDRSSRNLVAVFGMLKTFGGAPSEASSLNIDHFKRSLVAFFKIPFKPQEIDEVFQTLNRNGDGQLHVSDFIAGLQVSVVAL